MRNLFENALHRDGPVLIDGGLATQCEAQGCDLNNSLWSASLLHAQPAALVAAHLAYLEAGAEGIASASYQASRTGFASLGYTKSQADELIIRSIDLARSAVTQFCSDHPENKRAPWVAASLGPYGAIRQDGSEYTGDYGLSKQELRQFHEHRLALFDSSDADVIACETIPSLAEAQVLGDLLTACRKPAWISFSCRDDAAISDGTPIEQVAALFHNHPSVMAVGVNCTPPNLMEMLIKRIHIVVPDKAIIIYPNSGEVYDAADNSWSGTTTADECGAAALGWVQAGAKIVGGCCRMGPEHIRAMRDALSA